MVSKASDDLPEPDRPVITTSASRGIATVTSWRLCSRAPETTIWSCLLTRRSVGGRRTDRSNTCSRPVALCGPLGIGSGFGPQEGAPDHPRGAVAIGRAQPFRGAKVRAPLLDRALAPRSGGGGHRPPARP